MLSSQSSVDRYPSPSLSCIHTSLEEQSVSKQSTSASPSLSTLGSLALDPKKSSSNVSSAASAAFLAFSADVAEDAAAVAELAAFVAEVDALASAVSNPLASTENSKPVPPALADNT